MQIRDDMPPYSVSDFDILLCDFDGTLNSFDVTDEVLRRFASGDWQEVGRRYESGESSHEEMNSQFVSMLRAKPGELEEFVKTETPMRNGYRDFFAFLDSTSIVPIIVSGWWDICIRAAMSDRATFFPESFEDLSNVPEWATVVICNKLAYDEALGTWSVRFPWGGISRLSSPDKRAILDRLRKSGPKNVFVVWDGSTDYEMADSADFVFCRATLAKYCADQGLPHRTFESLDDVSAKLSEFLPAVRILSLPSYHPYNVRFDNGKDVVFVNPDDDTFSDEAACAPNSFERKYPPESYDLVHIHFEYYLIRQEVLRDLLEHFRSHSKAVVWTCHDRRSLVSEDFSGEYEKLMYERADRILTLTQWCADWLRQTFWSEKEIGVVPCGYMAHPAEVRRLSEGISKDPRQFVYLAGDLRKSKEIRPALEAFLKFARKRFAKLKILVRSDKLKAAEQSDPQLATLLANPEFETVSIPHITDELIIRSFFESHAVILPYRWWTHSGQLEMAKDCGCHVVASDVGYYREQWDDIRLWRASERWDEAESERFSEALSDVFDKEPRVPFWDARLEEFTRNILSRHVETYRKIIRWNEKRKSVFCRLSQV